MRPSHVSIGRFRLHHQTIRLVLLLLPVWVLGAGELAEFAYKNTITGPVERTGLVKGRDFLQFYVAGSLAHQGRWGDLYDVPALGQAVAEIVPAASGIIPAPVYPPHVASFFAPWAQLTYLNARWLWFMASAIAYLVAAGIVIHLIASMRGYRFLAWVTVVCNPALAMVLTTGQLSSVAVLAWALATVALANGFVTVCGLCLGLLAYKPPLLVGVVLVLMVTRAWAVLAGVLLSVSAQTAATMFAFGMRPWREYALSLGTFFQYYYLTDTLPHQKQSLLGFFQLLAGSELVALSLATAASIVVLGLWLKPRKPTTDRWFISMLAVSIVLLSPHFYVYDLVLLTPALIMAAAALPGICRSHAQRTLGGSGYALLYAPYSGAVAMHLGIQLSTIALLTFFFAMHRQSLSENVGAQ